MTSRHNQGLSRYLTIRASFVIRASSFLPCVATHQFALCNHMTFHRRVQLAPLRAGRQTQLPIQCENLEVITMRTRGWTRSAIARFPEVVCSLDSFWRASFGNRTDLRRNVPNRPMCEQSARRIGIIDDQDEAFRFGRYI